MTPQRLCAQTTDVDQSLLIVGTKESPPFSMKNESGTWTGISIELWRQIADKLDLNYQFKELSIPQILKGVTDGSLDAGVAAFTITSEREKKLDFSHSFYSTGLGIAVLGKDRNPFISMIKSVTSLPFLKVAFSLASLLFGIGFFIWFIEHKHNPVQFEDTPVKGIFSGFWWSAVTMTTVGFGDKTPRTVPGRLLGIVWMFSGIILISSFTAAITSSLTVARLESKIRTIADLPNVSVGTINNTTSELFLKDRHIFYITYPSPLEGLKAVQKGEIDAFLYDAPILRYLVLQTSADEIKVIHQQIARQDYGIALSQGSPLREPINQAMLENLQEGWWADTLTQYLGE
jgi:ABC-type amino acid transport substrate-binding protein